MVLENAKGLPYVGCPVCVKGIHNKKAPAKAATKTATKSTTKKDEAPPAKTNWLDSYL